MRATWLARGALGTHLCFKLAGRCLSLNPLHHVLHDQLTSRRILCAIISGADMLRMLSIGSAPSAMLSSRVVLQGQQKGAMYWGSNAQRSPLYVQALLYYFVRKNRENLNEIISCAPHAYDSGELESEHRNTPCAYSSPVSKRLLLSTNTQEETTKRRMAGP